MNATEVTEQIIDTPTLGDIDAMAHQGDGAYVAVFFFALVGVICGLTGIFILFGIGWTLIAGAVPCLGLAAIILRGMTRGDE